MQLTPFSDRFGSKPLPPQPKVAPAVTSNEVTDRSDLSGIGGAEAKPKSQPKKAEPKGSSAGVTPKPVAEPRPNSQATPATLTATPEFVAGGDLLTRKAGPMNWKPLIRELLYPVQFDNHPVDGLDRVFEQLVNDPENSHGPAGYLEAVKGALNSKEPLAGLVGMTHPEESVRQYLESVKTRLEGVS